MMSSSATTPPKGPSGKLYLTPEEVAERLSVSASWVRKKAQAGVLPYRRIGRQLRFLPHEIDAWAEKQH